MEGGGGGGGRVTTQMHSNVCIFFIQNKAYYLWKMRGYPPPPPPPPPPLFFLDLRSRCSDLLSQVVKTRAKIPWIRRRRPSEIRASRTIPWCAQRMRSNDGFAYIDQCVFPSYRIRGAHKVLIRYLGVREGRTETVRPCTMESCAFVRAMLDPSAAVCNFSFMSANWHPNPCSWPPTVYQHLRTLCDWPFHKVIVRLVWV